MSDERLDVGDRIPEFELPDQNGKTFRSNELSRPAVFYFYPHDDTPGCTAQACSFRDAFEYFTDMGVEVIGISSDDVGSHRRFAEKHSLPFTLLSDVDGEVRSAFGVPKSLGILPGRVTYVVDASGVIRYVFNSQMRTSEHVGRSLKILKEIIQERK
ncbi:MAG: peroxiredoxin [Candidatus Thermoplasmatota archaeon]|nr:peroxiredoxin [Candidatus Thermoplasmatota archaeon]